MHIVKYLCAQKFVLQVNNYKYSTYVLSWHYFLSLFYARSINIIWTHKTKLNRTRPFFPCVKAKGKINKNKVTFLFRQVLSNLITRIVSFQVDGNTSTPSPFQPSLSPLLPFLFTWSLSPPPPPFFFPPPLSTYRVAAPCGYDLTFRSPWIKSSLNVSVPFCPRAGEELRP